MASPEHSSVVFSVRQLLDAESERVAAEQAERDARHQREREQRLRSHERERLQAEQQSNQQREHEWHQRLTQEANLLKARLVQENEAALATLREQLEHEYHLRTVQRDAQLSAVTGRQRMLLAALATLLVGAGLCWSLVVVPGQRQASASYAALNELYAKLLVEQRERTDDWNRERRQLQSQLESIRSQHTASPSPPAATTGPAHPAIPGHRKPPESKSPCPCQHDDPLCPC